MRGSYEVCTRLVRARYEVFGGPYELFVALYEVVSVLSCWCVRSSIMMRYFDHSMSSSASSDVLLSGRRIARSICQPWRRPPTPRGADAAAGAPLSTPAYSAAQLRYLGKTAAPFCAALLASGAAAVVVVRDTVAHGHNLAGVRRANNRSFGGRVRCRYCNTPQTLFCPGHPNPWHLHIDLNRYAGEDTVARALSGELTAFDMMMIAGPFPSTAAYYLQTVAPPPHAGSPVAGTAELVHPAVGEPPPHLLSIYGRGSKTRNVVLFNNECTTNCSNDFVERR